MERTPTALERLIREGTEEDLRRFLVLLQPPEIADIIEALEGPEDRARAFRAIVGARRSSVLREVEGGERGEILEALDPAETARLVSDMKSDDAADILLDLDEAAKQAVLDHVEPAQRARLDQVLAHGGESAGGIMQTELVRVREQQTVREAVDEIRRTRDKVGELHEIFVVDHEGRLKGWVKERALILASDSDRIASITTPVPIRVPVGMDQEEIAYLVRDYDLSSVPVTDEEGRLVGRILVDDIVDVVTEEATEDITRLGGTDPEEIYEPSVQQALRSRVPWLVIPFLGGVIVSYILQAGEETVRRAGSLFAFIPVIMGMGGGTGVQAATVTVRSLALGRIRRGALGTFLRKELGTGALLAGGAGLLLWGIVHLTGLDPAVAWIAAAAIFGTITLGTSLGVLTPLLLERVGIDPAVATTPFVATVNDLLGSSIIVALTLWLL